jgi:hypothetical protein
MGMCFGVTEGLTRVSVATTIPPYSKARRTPAKKGAERGKSLNGILAFSARPVRGSGRELRQSHG